MKVWNRFKLMGTCGGHLLSCKTARIQVYAVPKKIHEKQLPLFRIPQGNLLINVLEGTCYLKNEMNIEELFQSEQAFLNEGESFNLYRESDNEVVVQMIWMPGIGEQ